MEALKAIATLIEPNIVNAMMAANKRGVKVTVVANATESKNANMYAILNKLTQAGVDALPASTAQIMGEE